ncbi:hypothetical protein H0H81_010127 [Sphagnurus paluster]|uniref:Uncharacterized protein n=1 Tax=Sphagnurus paluster TaxID=117069 RepID=A0A9P7FPA2_9AGAR|nr:hypothetical protein H0H81_010127 [Sphagnurus paluster]
MEGPFGMKRSLHDEDVSDTASKRLKPTESVSGDSNSIAPPEDTTIICEPDPTLTSADASTSGIQAPVEPTQTPNKRKNARPNSGKSKKEEKRVGRRSRRGTRNDEDAEENGQPKAPRLPKRQCALLIGFCGSGYSGMQIQPNHTKTIEGVLFQAMVRAGAVSEDNADDPVKIGLARAARTDAGVHAAGNLVSLKMITATPEAPDMVVRINEELPPHIRLWGYVCLPPNIPPSISYISPGPSSKFFQRAVCDSRKYTYFFPSYLLLPPKPGSGLDRSLQKFALTLSPDPSAMAVEPKEPHAFWAGVDMDNHEGELQRKRAWRVPHEKVQQLRRAAEKFEGTHNFHNFTVARDFSDRSNQRHMKKTEIADPVVYGDTEWISVLFHGQSFMLHQIVRLLLEEPIFDSYNTRMEAINAKLEVSDPDYRPPISFEAHREVIEAFKQKYIYDNMRQVEDRDGLFDAWMRYVDAYSGNDLLYLNLKGTIPQEAIIKKNECRDNPFREKKRFDATSFLAGEENETVTGVDEDEEDLPINKKDLADTEG